jgi:hypothetical protein
MSRGSSSTTSTTPHVRMLWHVARHVVRFVAPLVVDYSNLSRLVVDYFDYASRSVASARRAARRAAHHLARRQLLRLRRASGCLSTSRGSPSTTPPYTGLSSTTLTMPLVRVPWNVVRLVVNYFTYSARPVASARRAACRVTHRRLLRLAQARRRLLRLRRRSGCLGMSRGLSRGSSLTIPPRAGSSSTASTTTRVRLLWHVARLVTWLVVDYFASAARPGASARRAARCRLL